MLRFRAVDILETANAASVVHQPRDSRRRPRLFELELIPFYNFKHHRIGAGASYHLSPELDLKDAGGPRVEFDDALGWLVEYDYSFSGWNSSGVVLGVRYLWIDYEISQVDGFDVSGVEIDGSHVGIHVNYLF